MKLKIDRTQTLKQAVDSLGYEYKYISPDFDVKNDGDEEVDIEFFNLEEYASNKKVREEYKKRGLEPDVFATIALLKEHPKLLEEKKYIGIQLEGNSYVAFGRWDGERRVYCYRNDYDWSSGGWFAGRRPRKSLDSGKLGSSKDSLVLGYLEKIKSLIKEIEKELKKEI